MLSIVLLALLLGACATRSGGGRPGRDGPEARPPPDLDRVPDAVPRIEPLRNGGPNKPYDVLGQRYVPMSSDAPLQESGLASWYGRKFHGQPTSSGELYDMYAMTAAHKTMPIPSYARVTNPANGREVIVRINDRGPFASGRVIDLSYTAALKLGVLGGVAPVTVQRLTFDDIRRGLPARPVPQPLPAAPVVAVIPVTAPVVALPPDDQAPGDRPTPIVASAGFWLQFGAFRSRDSAVDLQQRLQRDSGAAWPAVAVFDEAGLFRVQAGPYATRAQAAEAGERQQRQQGLASLVIERTAAAP